MSEAERIYVLVKEYSSQNDLTFCHLHKCLAPDECDCRQHHEMLDFDEVKRRYCKEKGIRTGKSADGLAYNDNGILFLVEIKGWEKYEKYQRPQNERDIKEQVEGYGMSKKLKDSLIVCNGILSQTEKSVALPVVYLVASDIKADNAIEEIAGNLMFLSETSSDLSHVYGEELKSRLSAISDVDCGFIADCRQIDHEIKSWEKAREIKIV